MLKIILTIFACYWQYLYTDSGDSIEMLLLKEETFLPEKFNLMKKSSSANIRES